MSRRNGSTPLDQALARVRQRGIARQPAVEKTAPTLEQEPDSPRRAYECLACWRRGYAQRKFVAPGDLVPNCPGIGCGKPMTRQPNQAYPGRR